VSLWVLFFLKRGVRDSRLSLRALLGWCFVYFVSVLFLPFCSDVLLLSTGASVRGAISMERLELWLQLWQAAMSQPLWGYGWLQVSVAQVAVASGAPVGVMVEYSHNLLLDLILWNGLVVGCGIILVSILLGGRLLWVSSRMETLCCLLAVGVVMVHAMLEYPLAYAFFLLPVGLFLGWRCLRIRFSCRLPCQGICWVLFFCMFLFWYAQFSRVSED